MFSRIEGRCGDPMLVSPSFVEPLHCVEKLLCTKGASQVEEASCVAGTQVIDEMDGGTSQVDSMVGSSRW